jgi:AcrR family transcriptional regulator
MAIEPDPAIVDSKREALLIAARDLFLKNTYANISIRRIADKAKVNSAMIAYYFGSKSGLFREMMKSFIESKIEMASESIGHVNEQNLEDFFRHFYKTMPTELTHLIIRTMLFERGEMREWLIDNLMKPAFSAAMQISETVVDHKGKPIDPLVLRTTLQSMMILPKLLQPLLTELHPEEINPEFYDKLASFQAQLISQFFELEIN